MRFSKFQACTDIVQTSRWDNDDIYIYIRYVKKLLLLDLFMKIFEKKEMEEGTRKKRLRVFVYNFKY